MIDSMIGARIVVRLKRRKLLKACAYAEKHITALIDSCLRCEKSAVGSKSKIVPQGMAVVNLSAFVALCLRDICLLSTDAMISIGSNKSNLHSRHLAVAIYEFIEDFNSLTAKKFRYLLLDLNFHAELSSLIEVREEIRAIQKQHHSQLMKVRNYVAAHRDHDAFLQLRIINDMEPFAHINMATEILGVAVKFQNFTTETIRHMTALVNAEAASISQKH